MEEIEEYSCKNCKHYNDGDGDIRCDFCDRMFDDRFERKERDEVL